MKKLLFCLFLALQAIFIFAKDAPSLKKELSSVPVEYREFRAMNPDNPRKSYLTFDELKQDIDDFVYILQTAYAGYPEMLGAGFDKTSFSEKILKKYEGKTEIETRAVLIDLKNALSPYVQDNHFTLMILRSWNNFVLAKSYKMYFSDVFVKKEGEEKYVLFPSGENLSSADMIALPKYYTDSEEKLFLYPVKGKDVYRLGVMSSEPIEKADFLFGNQNYSLFVKSDSVIDVSQTLKYHEIETNDSAYVSINSFVWPEVDSSFRKGVEILFDKYRNLGIKWRKKKNIIIDIRSNVGGDSSLSFAFLLGLYDKKLKKITDKEMKKIMEMEIAYFDKRKMIVSPVTESIRLQYTKMRGEDSQIISEYEHNVSFMKEKPCRKVIEFGEKESEWNKPCYKGNIIILTDRNSVSAAEYTIAVAKKLFGERVYVIGENTMGCLTYGDVCGLTLNNSGIGIRLAFSSFYTMQKLKNWHGEGFGYYPDFWALGKDLNETIFLVTDDKEMKAKLKDIETRLM